MSETSETKIESVRNVVEKYSPITKVLLSIFIILVGLGIFYLCANTGAEYAAYSELCKTISLFSFLGLLVSFSDVIF